MSDNVPSVNVKVIEVGELLDKIPSQGTRDHKELERQCVIASLAIESLCGGTKFIRRTFTEDYDTHDAVRILYLNAQPIVSVTSITDDDSNTIASTEYTIVNPGNGAASYLEHDTYWPAPVGRWTVVYTAGIWEDTDDVDWDVKEWARLVALRANNNRGDSVTATTLSGRAGSRSVSRPAMGVSVWSEIEKATLAKYRRRGV